MAERDSRYLLDGLVELDDAYVGGKHLGTRGCAAKRRKPVLFAVQNNGNAVGCVVHSVDFRSVEEFCSRLSADAVVRSDACTGLLVISQSHEHHSNVTLPGEVAAGCRRCMW